MRLDLDGLTKKQLKDKLEAFKISDAPAEVKAEAIAQVEAKLGVFEKRQDVLDEISASQADIDDIE